VISKGKMSDSKSLKKEIPLLQGPSQQSNQQVNDQNMNKSSKRKSSSSSNGSGGKRKRKTFSCTSCRKLKTRCDFELQVGKCHRCNVLKLDCSLTHERRDEIEQVLGEDEEPSLNMMSNIGNGQKIEGEIRYIKEKLNILCDVLLDEKKDIIKGGKDLGKAGKINGDYEYFKGLKSKYNYLDNSTNNAPWNVINRIDFRLFKRFKKYEYFEKLCKEEFLQEFFQQNEEFCIKLANNFLTKAHFWIIPGGLTKIDKSYILKNPFITCVFILISLNFDHQEIKTKYEDQLQKKLYWIVRKLLGLAMTITPLSDHDIEAILYCSIYNIARKSEQPQLDTWSISGNGIKQMMIFTKFHALEKRVNSKQFDLNDLFHLRIWNSLCISHVQNSIGSGRPFLISEDYLKTCSLILKFPQINIEDNVRYAELQISKLSYELFYVKDLILEVIRLDQFIEVNDDQKRHNLKIIELKKLNDWFRNNEALIDQDISQVLMFCYEFYHIILTKRIISSFEYDDGDGDFRVLKFQKIGLNSIIYYSHELIQRFLKLKSFLIKGSPNFILNLIIYTSLTLYENLNLMDTNSKNVSINLITKIYWKLNQIGEMKNDATDSVGKIIKNLVLDNLGPAMNQNLQMSNSQYFDSGRLIVSQNTNYKQLMEDHQTDPDLEYEPLHDDVNHDYTNDYNNIFMKQQQTISSLRSTSVPTSSSSGHGVHHGIANNANNSNVSTGVDGSNSTLAGFEIPDVGKFDTFEDFFKDMFR